MYNNNAYFQYLQTDKENHGFGLKTMQEIVERYHGELELKTKDGHCINGCVAAVMQCMYLYYAFC